METYTVGSVIAIAISGLAAYYGYTGAILGWCQDKWAKVQLVRSLLNNMNVKDEKVEGRITHINDGDKSMTIAYKYFGVDYIVTVPFRRDYVVPMSGYKVSVRKNDTWIDVTQQPGVPYLVSAEQLGANGILITNTDTGKSISPHVQWVPDYVTYLME